jgi:hypothetical protein
MLIYSINYTTLSVIRTLHSQEGTEVDKYRQTYRQAGRKELLKCQESLENFCSVKFEDSFHCEYKKVK